MAGMKPSQSRRIFLGQGATALAFPYLAKTSWAKKPPSETVRHASFGGGGMAGADLSSISSHPKVTVAAVVEIDPGRRRQIQQRFRNAKVYADWREMLEKECKNLHTANVSAASNPSTVVSTLSSSRGRPIWLRQIPYRRSP